MRVSIMPNSVMLWLSANDTYRWARRAGYAWPGSQLSDKRVFAEFDSNGLVDVTIDGKSGVDVDGNEFNAITSDFLATRLPKDHPAYLVSVGQFQPAFVTGLAL